MNFRFNCWLLFLSCLAACILLLMSGCGTVLAPQTHLDSNIQKHLGRPISIEKELDIRVYIDGPIGIYAGCNRMNPVLWLLSTPLFGGYIFGCSERQCGEKRMWETKKICTCEIHQSFDADWIYQHELRHCQGYGEW